MELLGTNSLTPICQRGFLARILSRPLHIGVSYHLALYKHAAFVLVHLLAAAVYISGDAILDSRCAYT